jgi:hypothetical protein
MKDDDSSLTSASTLMLPSGFFWPAMPVTFEEPSSIATINSLSATIIFLFRYYFLFRYFGILESRYFGISLFRNLVISEKEFVTYLPF